MKTINRMIDSTLTFWWRLLDLLGTPTAVIRGPLPPELAQLNPKSAGLEFYEVKIPTELGRCPAWVVPANDSNDWVVFIHGRGGERVGTLDMLPFVHALGFNALVITHRNDWVAPKSPDGRDHLGAEEWKDLEAAVEFIVEANDSVGDIDLFARSAGAAVVGQFLNLSNYAPMIDRVILDEPVLDWNAVFMAQRPKWLPKLVAWAIIWGNARKVGVRMGRFNWVKRPPADRPPVLVFHTTDDEVCPVQVSRDFALHHPKDWKVVLVEFPTGAHAGARFEEPAKYMGLVRHWLRPDETEKRLSLVKQAVSA